MLQGAKCLATIATMSTIEEIETAIERLPEHQLTELIAWLEQLRRRRGAPPAVETWLDRARGAARSGITTEEVMEATRGDQ
jgi:hypothetical protein